MKLMRNRIYSGILLMFMMLFIMCVPTKASEISGDEDIIDWGKSTYTTTAGQNDTVEWRLKLKENYQNGLDCPVRIYNFRIQFSEEEWTYIYPKLSEDGTEWIGSYELSDYGINGTYEILSYSYQVNADLSDHTITIDGEWGDCVVSGLKSETDKPVIDLTKAKVYGDKDKIFAGDTVHFLIPASDAESGVRTVWFTTYRLINETDCEYYCSMNLDVDSPSIESVDDGYVFSMPIEKPGTYMVLDYQASDMCKNTKGVEIVSYTRDEDGTYHYEKKDEYKQYFDQLTYTVYERQLTVTSVGGQYRYLEEGEDTELKAEADCKDASLKIAYQWYIKESGSDEWALIEDATELNYHVTDARKTAEYKCLVKTDNGEEAEIIYTVDVEKIPHLSSDETECSYLINKKSSGTMELKPVVYSDVETTLHYNWYYQDYDDENATELMTTGDTCLVDTSQINKKRFYTCDVSAEIDGETEHLIFTYEFAIDTGLEWTGVYYNKVYVKEGDSKEIDARDYYDIYDEYKDGITYQWYLWEDDMIEGETLPTIKSEPVTEKVRYSVVIKDICGNEETVHIDLCIDAGFSTEENSVTLFAKKGETVTLTPVFEISDECRDTLNYDWFGEDEWLETEEGTSLTTDPITDYTYYEARISDKYGNVYYFYYDIFIDTGLSVSETEIDVSVKEGERVELKAPAIFIYDGYQYSLQWRVQPQGALYAFDMDGQTKDTLVIDSAKESVVYYLIIRDDYEKYISIRYNFTVVKDTDVKQPELVTLSDIKIAKMPTKTKYVEGERFDKTGLIVMANYSDGSSEDVTNKVEILTEVLKTTDKNVVVRFEGKTAAIPVSVSAKQEEEKIEVGDATASKEGSYAVTEIKEDGTVEVEFRPSADAKKQKTVTVDSMVTIEGKSYPVTAIADNAFKGDTKVKTVKLPKTIETIGDNAFSGCKNLTKVDLSKTNTKTIGKNAFKGTKITTVKLPASTTTIKATAFANCDKLKTITLGKNTTKIAANAFKGSKNIKKITFKSDKVPSKKDIKGVKSLGKKVTIKVPKKQKDKYIKVLRAAGFKGKIS